MDLFNGYTDLLAIAETKLDDSFPEGQFIKQGYKKPYRFDKSSRSGGLLVYVRSDIPSKLLTSFAFQKDIQIITIELNLHRQKWLVITLYKPPQQDTKHFLHHLSEGLDFYYRLYNKVFIIGDFNLEPSSKHMIDFMESYNLHCLYKDATCFKTSKGHA